MMKNLLLLLVFILVGLASAQADTRIWSVDPQVMTNPSSFAFGEYVTTNFEYETNEPGGVMVFVRPMTNGNITPGYGASGSPLYTGTGTGNSSFTITGGTKVIVDELRVQVYNSDQSVLLMEFYKPVTIRFSANALPFIQLENQGRGSYIFGEQFDIYFQYNINVAGGARIFFRPLTSGSGVEYAASGSDVYTGFGSETAYFTLNAGMNALVFAIRVRIYNADQSELLDEFNIPVYLKYSNTAIRNVDAPGAIYFYNNDNVEFSFEYETTQAGGIRVFFRPFTDDALTPNYTGAGSVLYPMGAGSGTSSYTVTTGNTIVDQTRVQVYNAAQTELLLEYFLPAEYVTGDFDFWNFKASPPTAARLPFGEEIQFQFNYNNMTAATALVFIRPFTNGSLTPNYSASGSPNYEPGSTTGYSHFTITSGEVVVDALRVQVTDISQSTVILEFFLPVHYQFGGTSDLELLPENVSKFYIYPNPSQGATTANFQLEESGNVQVNVVNLMGQTVQSIDSVEVQADHEQEVQLNTTGLSNGIYFVQLKGKNLNVTRRWLINR